MRGAFLPAFLFATLLALSGCATTQSASRNATVATVSSGPADAGTHPAVGAFPSTSTLTDIELQQELQAFVDRYIQRLMETADEGVSASDQAQEREVLNQFKAASASSAVSIATSPNPLHGLRDMRVMLRLQRQVWRDGGPEHVAKARAGTIHRELVLLEDQINLIAARVIPVEAMRKLDERIDAWHKNNPTQTSVAFIRFHNLDLADKQLERETASSGLLAPVAEAVREVNEARKMADRALFLANHLPMLVQWRGELLARRVLAAPEAGAYLDEAKAMRATLKDMIDEASNAQRLIHNEREQIQGELERYRPILQQLTHDFSLLPGRISSERQAIFEALDEGAVNYKPTLDQLANISGASRDAANGLERILSILHSKEGMTVEQISSTLDKLLVITERSARITDLLANLLSKDAKTVSLEALDSLLVEHERRIFGYTAALLVLIAVLSVLVRYFWLRLPVKPD